jgi:hypothetical protein
VLRTITPSLWRGWLLLAVALWMSFAPAAFAAGLPQFFTGPATSVIEESSDSSALHIYLYANADPVGMFDPSGNFSLMDISSAQGVLGGLFRMASIANRIFQTIDKATTAIETLSLVRNLTLFFMNPAGSGLQQALALLRTAAGVDRSFARFLTIDGLREAVDVLAGNSGRIALEIGKQGILPEITNILAKPNSDVVLYMPTPALPNLGINIPPIKTGIRFKGRDVVLYFGKSSNENSIGKAVGGRVFGLGVTDPSRKFPFQIFRMDWHEKHGPTTYDWYDGNYHFHMGKKNQ